MQTQDESLFSDVIMASELGQALENYSEAKNWPE